MGIFSRLSSLIRSNANALLDSATDPGKEVEQRLDDMQSAAKQSRAELARALADEKIGKKKVLADRAEADGWRQKAEVAARAGDDGLAKEALIRAAEIDANATQAEHELAEGRVALDQLADSLRTLDARIDQIKAHKETIKVVARNAKNGPPGTAAFADYERTLGKIDTLEAEVALNDELLKAQRKDAASLETERKLDQLGHESEAEARLKALKEKLGK